MVKSFRDQSSAKGVSHDGACALESGEEAAKGVSKRMLEADGAAKGWDRQSGVPRVGVTMTGEQKLCRRQ